MLRKQWQQELDEKFFLPSVILDSKVFNQLKRDGQVNPFDQSDKIVICSYHFAAAKIAEIGFVPWGAVAIDESHRMRNVHRSRTRLANNPAANKTMAHKTNSPTRNKSATSNAAAPPNAANCSTPRTPLIRNVRA